MQVSLLKYIFATTRKFRFLMPLAIWISEKYFKRRYRIALAIKEKDVKDEELRRLTALRQRFHPSNEFYPVKIKIDNNIFLKANLCQQYCGDIYYGVGFEQSELTLVREFVGLGETFFDVGANIGVYSLLASKFVGAAGRVHSFEPLPDVNQLLGENIRLNKVDNVMVELTAVGDKNGEAQFFINAQNALSGLGNTKRGAVVHSRIVPITTLDTYAAKAGISKIDFLKIDVEGFEGHVLRGARSLLARSSDVIVMSELAKKNLAPLGFSIREIIDWMAGLGLESWMIGDQELKLYPVALDAGDDFPFQNFLFIHPENKKYSLVGLHSADL